MIEQYDHKTLVGMFDGQDVSPILPYDSIDADVATIDASTQASGRISISGVQPKYAMVVDNGVLRFAREGEQGRFILKIAPIEPHIIERPWVPVNEWMTMRMAEQVYGIPTAKNCLCYFRNGSVAYITRRFDVQPDGSKWLQEDFASIANISKDTNGSDYKYNAMSYAECGALIDRYVSAALVEKLKFFRLVVFNYLTCNDDAHLKNFSLMSIDGTDYRLTPAYDLLNTQLHLTNPHIFALTKGLYPGMISDDTHSVTGASFEEFGRQLGLPDKLVAKELADFRTEKPQAKELIYSCGLPENLARSYYWGYDYRRQTLSFK
jgi:serine/threonine-protein kinase HipA